MLWEPADAAEVLPSRFGLADAADVVRWLTGVLDGYWGIRLLGCQRIVLSDRNALAWLATDAGPKVAKWSVARNQFDRLAALAALTSRLDRQWLPVAAPTPAADGRVQLEVDGVSINLQQRVDGDHLDVTDAAQVRAAGAVLARLHQALATAPEAPGMPGLSAPEKPVAVQLGGWLESKPRHLPADLLDSLGAVVSTAQPDPDTPIQLVHGDFRAANLLLRGTDMAAVLDFDDARMDHRVVELARSAALLGTVFHHWAPVRPEVHASFVGGYQSVSTLTAAEAAWVRPLIAWYSVLVMPADGDPAGWGGSAREVLAAQALSVEGLAVTAVPTQAL